MAVQAGSSIGAGALQVADAYTQAVLQTDNVNAYDLLTVGGVDVSNEFWALRMDSAGNLLVNVAAGGGAGNPTGDPVPANATYIAAQDESGNLAGLLVDASGYLLVDVATGGGGGGGSSATITPSGAMEVAVVSDGLADYFNNLERPIPVSVESLPPSSQVVSFLPLTGQAAIAVTGTAVPLPSSYGFQQGVVITARTGNSANIYLGGLSVLNGFDPGNGYELTPGSSIQLPITSLSLLAINGTLGDGITWIGV